MAYVIGKDTLLKVEIGGAGGTLTTIPQVVSITPPALEMGSVETTHLESVMRENKATIIDPGEMSFNLEYDPANTTHQAIYAYFLAGTTIGWTITLSDAGAAVIAFDGFIQNFGIDELTVDSVVTIPVTVRITGETTITP